MNKNNSIGALVPMTVTEGVTVNVLPNEQYEYLMTTKEVAHGYGTTTYAIQQALHRNPTELIVGKHFTTALTICQSDLPTQLKCAHNAILWSKRGIVRLGFFIKSEQARIFRDWAEELIIKIDEQRDLFGVVKTTKSLPAKRNHNRITQDRLIRLLQLTHRIEDSTLRTDIVNELMGGHSK